MSCSPARFNFRYLLYAMLLISTFACQPLNKKVKYYSAEITLKNGTVLKGSTSPIADDSFSFKDAQTSKKLTILNTNVQSVIKHLPEGVKEYAQFEVENKKKREKNETILAAYIVKGDISLIATEATEYVRRTKDINNRMTFVNETILVKHLYLKRRNEPGTEVPASNRKIQEEDFMDVALTYFADAPELMRKIGSTGYEAIDIKKIVEEYNKIKPK